MPLRGWIRKVSSVGSSEFCLKALTFSAGGAVHCIKTRHAGIAFRGAKVTVRRYLDGRMDVVFKGRELLHPAAQA